MDNTQKTSNYVGIDAPSLSGPDVPLKISKGADAGLHCITQYLLLPHIMIAFLWKSFRDIFNLRVRGPHETLTQFWAGVIIR